MISNQQSLKLSPYMDLYNLIVPKDNMLRKINDLVDFSFVYDELKDKYCMDYGRNAIDPIRMFKYLLLKTIHDLYDVDVVERKLDKAEMTQSMSRVGRCIDNGPMEAIWGTLKCEKYYLRKYRSFEELSKSINEYIHFYNHERLQKRLNGLSPMEYRAKAA